MNMDLKQILCSAVEVIFLAQDTVQWRSIVNPTVDLGSSTTDGEYLVKMIYCLLSVNMATVTSSCRNLCKLSSAPFIVCKMASRCTPLTTLYPRFGNRLQQFGGHLKESCFWTSSIVKCFLKTQRFGNWICFRLQVIAGLRLALSKEPNR
jgi:hypothetical protein